MPHKVPVRSWGRVPTQRIPEDYGFHNLHNGYLDSQNGHVDFEQWFRWGRLKKTRPLCLVRGQKIGRIGHQEDLSHSAYSGCLKGFRVWRARGPEQVCLFEDNFPLVPGVWFLVIKVTGRKKLRSTPRFWGFEGVGSGFRYFLSLPAFWFLVVKVPGGSLRSTHRLFGVSSALVSDSGTFLLLPAVWFLVVKLTGRRS